MHANKCKTGLCRKTARKEEGGRRGRTQNHRRKRTSTEIEARGTQEPRAIVSKVDCALREGRKKNLHRNERQQGSTGRRKKNSREKRKKQTTQKTARKERKRMNENHCRQRCAGKRPSVRNEETRIKTAWGGEKPGKGIEPQIALGFRNGEYSKNQKSSTNP